MKLMRRQYLILVPVATIFFIFGTIYSTHTWTDVQQLHKDQLTHETGVGNTHSFSHERPDEGHNLDDPNCAGFPRDRLSDIQIVLRIGSTQPFDQISSHVNNITNCISNLIIISDRVESIGNGFWSYDIISDLPKVYWEGIDKNDGEEADQTAGLKAYKSINNLGSSWETGKNMNKHLTHREGWLLDRFKFLPMVEYAYNVNPQAKWFYFIEADTYVVWDTLWRLLDRYDPTKPWYMGSPSPGRDLENGEKTWFAYGGTGFILSRPAIQQLVRKDPIIDESGDSNHTELSLTEKWADLVKSDCCGDSVLGYALAKKGIILSGLYPLFNPHPLHGIPFGPSGKPYWCQPVLSMHKTWPGDVPMLSQFLKDRTDNRPLIYADLFDYLGIHNLSLREEWQNADWNGFEEGPESPVHSGVEACLEGCQAHAECFQWTFWEESSWEWKSPPKKKCSFVRSIRLGNRQPREETWTKTSDWTSGWDISKITKWVDANKCAGPEWVEPSLERIY